MTSTKQNSKLIDEYIAQFPQEVQVILVKIRKVIKKSAPGAIEVMSYGVPTFDLDLEHLIHYAAFKKHIGIYPTPSAIVKFKKELEGYETSKGTIQFPLDEPIPYELIQKIVEFRVDSCTD
ncbi:MAG: DUF1801 domain-containing protein [Patescibacteria group bacterium]|nr:DUF1801 domain-containing protein [Patescibacteria group bacterium]